jgi:hypothetical protein
LEAQIKLQLKVLRAARFLKLMTLALTLALVLAACQSPPGCMDPNMPGMSMDPNMPGLCSPDPNMPGVSASPTQAAP